MSTHQPSASDGIDAGPQHLQTLRLSDPIACARAQPRQSLQVTVHKDSQRYGPGFCKKPNMLLLSRPQDGAFMGKGRVDEHVFNAVARAAVFGKCAYATVLSDNPAVTSIVTYVDELPDPRQSQLRGSSNLTQSEPAADWTPFTLSEQKGQQAIYALMRLSITSRDRWGLDPSMPFDKWFKVVCAAKHEGLPMRYVEEWSRSGGDKFDAKALATIRRVYQEAHPTGRVGAGTVIMLYREQAPARAPPPAPLALDLFDGDTAFERALVEATDRAISTMALAASPSAYLTRELTAADLRTPEQHQMSAANRTINEANARKKTKRAILGANGRDLTQLFAAVKAAAHPLDAAMRRKAACKHLRASSGSLFALLDDAVASDVLAFVYHADAQQARDVAEDVAKNASWTAQYLQEDAEKAAEAARVEESGVCYGCGGETYHPDSQACERSGVCPMAQGH